MLEFSLILHLVKTVLVGKMKMLIKEGQRVVVYLINQRKNKNNPSNGKHTVVLFRFIYLVQVKELFSTREIKSNLWVVSFYLSAHKELFIRKFASSSSWPKWIWWFIIFSTRTGFCWPPSKHLLLASGLTYGEFDWLPVCYTHVMSPLHNPRLEGIMVSSYQPKFIIYVFVGSFIASAGSLPLLPDSRFLFLFSGVCTMTSKPHPPLMKKHSQTDLISRLKSRKILGVGGEDDDGEVHRSKVRLRSAMFYSSQLSFFSPFQDAFAHQTA